jgi:acyl-coenzyme A synthetase/AMP-(fatty) acid ligase
VIPLGRADHHKKVNGILVNIFKLNSDLKSKYGEEIGELIFLKDERSEHQIVLVTENSKIKATEIIVKEFNRNQRPSEKIRGVYFLKQIPRTSLGKISLPKILGSIDPVGN